MINEHILLTSLLMFFIGIVGCIICVGVLRKLIAIEITFLSSVINFLYFSQWEKITIGHFSAVIIIMLSHIYLAVIFFASRTIAK